MTATRTAAPSGRLARLKENRWAAPVLSVMSALIFWELVVLASEGWVPGSWAILQAMVSRLAEPELYLSILITLGRIAVAFSVSFLVGTALGFAMGYWRWVDAFWRPIVAIALAIPDPVYFIMAILIIGTGEAVSLFALILAVLPFCIGAVAGNVRARDPKLDDMAFSYRFGGRMYLRHVLVPQMAPAIAVAARTAFAFSWKIGVLMEALVRTTGLGAEIFYAFRLFKSAEMIALAIIFIAVMRAIEVLVFVRLERRLNAWRV